MVIYITEYCLAATKKKICSRWMDLETNILSEVALTPNNKLCMFSFACECCLQTLDMCVSFKTPIKGLSRGYLGRASEGQEIPYNDVEA